MENASKEFKGWDSIFATRLRGLMDEIREGKKTTQDMLASYVSTKRQTISQYADGSIMPNIDKLYKIAKYFNVSADYLLGLAKIKSPNMQDKEINRVLGLNGNAIEKLKETQAKIEKTVALSKTQSSTKEFFDLNNELPFLEGTLYAINNLLSDNAVLGTRAIDTLVEYLLFNESETYNLDLNNTTYTARGEKVSYFLIDELHNKLKALKQINHKGDK